jgi:hypothetical protein
MAEKPLDLDTRIEKLERHVLRLTGLVGLLFVLTLVLVAWKLLPGDPTLSARAFVVQDTRGVPRAELSLRKDGSPAVRLNNVAGRARAILSLQPDGSIAFQLNDEKGIHRSEWSLAPDGSPHLMLVGTDNHSHVALDVDAANQPRLVIRDAALHTLDPSIFGP